MTFVRAVDPPMRPFETTGYAETFEEKRPARATGAWSDVWARMSQRPSAIDMCRVLGEPGQSFIGSVGKPPAV